MRKLLTILTLTMALNSFAVENEEPIITFKTNIYALQGATNNFTIRLGSTQTAWFDYDCGGVSGEVEVEPATFDADASQIKATSISCNVDKEGIVKIYGDASLIDYFDGEGAYIEWIDLTKCSNLEIIDLQHNQLQRLDLSPFTKLSAAYLTDNTFTPETPLVIGTNHPSLLILEVDIVDYMDPDFDITYYPNLISFDAYHNLSLTHLDPSKCPNLQRLSVDSCPIRSLDVSKNTNLRVLNIEDSGINSIDVSKNTKLTQLYAAHGSGSINTDRKLSSIDISKNTELTYLTLTGNRLKEIDLSNNPLITNLYLGDNLLTHIDVSKQEYLSNFYIRNNYLTFATLPLPDASWFDYQYEQMPMPINRSFAEGTVIDFSDKVLRSSTTTTCELYAYSIATNATRKLDASYFDYADGKVTLKKAYTDSLYLSFENSAFSGVPLLTEKFMVKTAANYGKPTEIIQFGVVMSEGSNINLNLGMEGASETAPKTLFINPGDGNLIEVSVNSSVMTETANVSFTRKGSGNISIFVPEGEILSAFGIEDTYLSKINLLAATDIKYLKLKNTELYTLDLRYNRMLQQLIVSGNHLSTGFSLEGINGRWLKNMLSYIDLSNNELPSVILNETRAIKNLNLSHNKLTEFDYKEFEHIQTFDISYNNISDINVSYMYYADRVDISHNELTNVILPDQDGMTYLDLSNNKFTFADLPEAPAKTIVYHYAPQAEIIMPVKAPGANLSEQNKIVNGIGTTFVWKTISGETLKEGIDYQITNGATAFLSPAIGKKVYCMMTNPALPEFNGDNALRTTVIEVAAMPDNLIASFSTPKGGQNVELSLAAEVEGTAVYFDWSGNGSIVEQYILGKTYRRFPAKTVEGATVKVYTYSTDDHITVFSISGASMGYFDGSKLADAHSVMIYDAGLDKIKLPENAAKVIEISLAGNAFTNTDDVKQYTNLQLLNMSRNKLTSFDATQYKYLKALHLDNNQLTDIKLGNNNLWLMTASYNQLSAIDFNGAKNIEQFSLDHNLFSTIDISMLKKLNSLILSSNYFTFTTLPAALNSDGTSKYGVYRYGNQNPLDVECVNGKVDLSSQYNAAGKETTYHWFIGVPEVDEEGNLVGEELYVDDEYTINEGISTFLINYNGVMCVMTNPAFPQLYLYTNFLNVTTGIEDVSADYDGQVQYFNLQGIKVTNPSHGNVYIIKKGNKSSKILYR